MQANTANYNIDENKTEKVKRHLFKRFMSYYKPHIKLFILDMACALLISVFNLLYPYLTKEVINNYVPNKMLYYLLGAGGLMLGFYMIKAVLNYIMTRWGHMVGTRMQGDMRRELFSHLQKLPFGFFDENKTGSIMSRMTNDLHQVVELAHHGPEDVALSIITIIGAFIMLSTINIYLALIVFAFIPIIAICAFIMRKKMNIAYAATRAAQAEVNADIETAITGVKVSRAYNGEAHEAEKFEGCNDRFQKTMDRRYDVMGKFHSVMTFFTDFLYFVILLAGGLFFYFDIIDGGEFTAFILYISTLISPIKTLVTIYDEIQEGSSGFVRFCDLMDVPPEADEKGAIHVEKLNGDIELKNVTFSYHSNNNDKPVIDDFTMKVNAGKTVGLIGPSGGGKTTICNLIPRFYEIDGGQILIDGHNIKDISRYDLRKNIGIVQQDVFLFNGTVKENIAFGNFDATDDEIIEAAKKANIHDYVMTLPNGYDTNVGERGVKLSGGQKQRVSIARAFLKNPPILILDEATSALDNATEMLIQDALNSLSIGRTTIVVAHRLSTVKNADEIVVVVDGKVSDRGSHNTLMSHDGLYKQLYNYQFKN